MTLGDWLEVTPSEWMERAVPGWRQGYGDVMRTTTRDWLEMAYAPFTGQAYAPFTSQTPWPAAQPLRSRRRHRGWRCGCEDDHEHRKPGRHDCGCSRCGRDSCECYCCIGDVDIVVYTRLGEQRVVPISVANERRREKTIKLELSSWTTRSGDTDAVKTVGLAPDEFTLEPCGMQEVTLVIDVPRERSDAPTGKRPSGTNAREERKRLPDVDSCQVVTADLRLVGCDHRSLRLAAAILPRDCDPYRVSCGCTCC